jgi:hypothetical protein
MNGEEPAFRWDTLGITALSDSSSKFVRFDKHGIYGLNEGGVDGFYWQPEGELEEDRLKDIDSKATFALTWEGLKVTGNEGVAARIGKQEQNIMRVSKQTEEGEINTFLIKNDGSI